MGTEIFLQTGLDTKLPDGQITSDEAGSADRSPALIDALIVEKIN
jgi:hypothetical protein